MQAQMTAMLGSRVDQMPKFTEPPVVKEGGERVSGLSWGGWGRLILGLRWQCSRGLEGLGVGEGRGQGKEGGKSKGAKEGRGQGNGDEGEEQYVQVMSG